MRQINLRTLREAAGLSQGELAEKSKVPRETICRIECGHQSPTVETLEALAKALGITTAALLPS